PFCFGARRFIAAFWRAPSLSKPAMNRRTPKRARIAQPRPSTYSIVVPATPRGDSAPLVLDRPYFPSATPLPEQGWRCRPRSLDSFCLFREDYHVAEVAGSLVTPGETWTRLDAR